MTTMTVSTTRSTLRSRPRGLDGALYAVGMSLAAWARTHAARRAADRDFVARERAWRDAVASYAQQTREADVLRYSTIR